MKITVLLHGPWVNNIIKSIINQLQEYCVNKNNGDEIQMVIVSYVGDVEELRNCLNSIGPLAYQIKIVEIKDLFNPGFYNINRQIYSVSSGLHCIEADQFVLKIRNDQSVDFEKLIRLLRHLGYFCIGEKKFITTNCYTRKDRFYHPSDMLLCGWRDDLIEYYSAPLMQETSAEWKLRMLQVLEEDSRGFEKVFLTPESYLFTNYLQKKKWELQYTEQDNYRAINQYFYVINSWDIDFRWNKARVPGRKSGNLILPMWGKSAPFAWDTPICDSDGNLYYENVQCYEKSDFTGKRTKKDEYYIELSKKLYMWAGMPDEKLYKFPFSKIKRENKIVLYGAGNIGKILYKQLTDNNYSNIVLWVDKYYEELRKNNISCDSPQKIVNEAFDWLLIAVEKKEIADSIRQDLINMGICKEKILWSNRW